MTNTAGTAQKTWNRRFLIHSKHYYYSNFAETGGPCIQFQPGSPLSSWDNPNQCGALEAI
jgi:hypothetical protein